MIVEEEESKHHTALARDLRSILVAGATRAVASDVVLPAPRRDHEGEWPLAEVRHPEHAFDDLVPISP
jgi:hypothetical protein